MFLIVNLCMNVFGHQSFFRPYQSSVLIFNCFLNFFLIMTSGTFDLGLSDHCLIYGIIRLQRKRIPPKYISAKNYRQVNVETLKHAFTTAPWSAIEAFDDPDDIAWAWETLYKDIVNDHIPQGRVKIRSGSLP